MPTVPGFRDDSEVKAYESSNAEEPCIWLSVETLATTAIAQLPLDKATALAEQIEYLVAHHYQNDPS